MTWTKSAVILCVLLVHTTSGQERSSRDSNDFNLWNEFLRFIHSNTNSEENGPFNANSCPSQVSTLTIQFVLPALRDFKEREFNAVTKSAQNFLQYSDASGGAPGLIWLEAAHNFCIVEYYGIHANRSENAAAVAHLSALKNLDMEIYRKMLQIYQDLNMPARDQETIKKSGDMWNQRYSIAIQDFTAANAIPKAKQDDSFYLKFPCWNQLKEKIVPLGNGAILHVEQELLKHLTADVQTSRDIPASRALAMTVHQSEVANEMIETSPRRCQLRSDLGVLHDHHLAILHRVSQLFKDRSQSGFWPDQQKKWQALYESQFHRCSDDKN